MVHGLEELREVGTQHLRLVFFVVEVAMAVVTDFAYKALD
jgi:hypothetical protein